MDGRAVVPNRARFWFETLGSDRSPHETDSIAENPPIAENSPVVQPSEVSSNVSPTNRRDTCLADLTIDEATDAISVHPSAAETHRVSIRFAHYHTNSGRVIRRRNPAPNTAKTAGAGKMHCPHPIFHRGWQNALSPSDFPPSDFRCPHPIFAMSVPL